MSVPQQDQPLRGKIALITGCSGGIGRATAFALARQGCSIAVHYHSSVSKAQELVVELAASYPDVLVAMFQADLGDYDQVRKLHKEVTERFGPVELLFNNAGVTGPVVGPRGELGGVSIEEYEKTWKVNAGSAFLLTQLCLPGMLEKGFGRIVFCSSAAAATGGVIGPHYASSKSALHGLMHWIAQRYAKDNITCNAVAPALIAETTMMADTSEERRKLIPVGRFGVPGEVAAVVEMLMTNSYMTNKIIPVDGGYIASAF